MAKMPSLQNVKLRSKILSIAAILVVSMIAISSIFLIEKSKIDTLMSKEQLDIIELEKLVKLEAASDALILSILSALVDSNSGAVSNLKDSINALGDLEESWDSSVEIKSAVRTFKDRAVSISSNPAKLASPSPDLAKQIEAARAAHSSAGTLLSERHHDLSEELTMLQNAIHTEWSYFVIEFFSAVVISTLAALAFSMIIGRSIEKPILKLSAVMQALSEDNLDVEISGTDRGDEIGEMSRTVQVFHAGLEKVRMLDNASKVLLEAAADYQGQIEAISKAQAVIEFELDGKIVSANENFLSAMGYDLAEIEGKHHSMFVPKDVVNSPEYTAFWKSLGRGEYHSDEFLRIGKGNKEVWIQASYNAILDTEGKPVKVVKYATDITARKQAVEQLSAGLQKLADGDLSVRMTGTFDANFEIVQSSFNTTMERLTSLVRDIKASSATMVAETEEISNGAQKLSQRATSQAAALEETNAAMEAMANKISGASQSARDVNAAAKEAAKSANNGGETVGEAIAAMNRIETNSAKIAEIISVIESIAFQTNLLALNAAVEAARAGEAGKGFSVVASEVRTLAQRASEAANDITQLIDTATSEISEGAIMVRKTGEDLEKINQAVSIVGSSVEEISQSSSEQASGVSEISMTITTLDADTQQNAQLSESSASNAQKLANAADGLMSLVAYFSSDTEPSNTGSKTTVSKTSEIRAIAS